MAGKPKTRTRRELKIQPEGEADGKLPRTFALQQWLWPEREDGRTYNGWVGDGAPDVTTLIRDISRDDAVKLITELADWLAWPGEGQDG